MITLQVEQASIDQLKSYLERVRQGILRGIREGMMEGMQGLAAAVVTEMGVAAIVNRTGALSEAILDSPKVTETPEVIRGTVTAAVGKKRLGIWLEEGTHVPAVEGNLFQFTEPDASTLYARGHRAFDVKPHPFMNPALREFKGPIMAIIEAHVAEAYEG